MMKNTEKSNILPKSKFVRGVIPFTIASAAVFLVANTINVFWPATAMVYTIALYSAIISFATVVAMAIEKIIRLNNDSKKKKIPASREKILTMQKESSEVEESSKTIPVRLQKFKAKVNQILAKKHAGDKKTKAKLLAEEDDAEKNL